jgi:hypothetical protein
VRRDRLTGEHEIVTIRITDSIAMPMQNNIVEAFIVPPKLKHTRASQATTEILLLIGSSDDIWFSIDSDLSNDQPQFAVRCELIASFDVVEEDVFFIQIINS